MASRALFIGLSIVVAGCGSTAQTEPSQTTARRSAATSPANRGAPDAEEQPGRPARVDYDLAGSAARATLWQRDTVVVDFGRDGAAKYTLGGWRSDIEPARVDGRPVGLVTGRRGTVYLPWHGTGDAVLTLRAQVLARGAVQLQLNGESLPVDTWPRGSAGTVRLRLPEKLLRRGDNRLLLRSRRVGRTPDGRAASLALDWIRLGPTEDGHREDEPPALEAAFASVASGVPAVRMRDGWTLGWTLEVPADARLRGVVRGKGAVAVRLRTDDGRVRPVGHAAGGTFDFPLSDHAGQVVQLELTAQGEPTLLRPSVVTPAPARSPERHRPRNVLIYLVDTLRADKLEPYDAHTRVRTPGIARFVRGASTFLGARAQENWTKPSVATLLSGLMPWQHTATEGNSVLPDAVELLPEMLHAKGFYTGSFIANGYVSDKFGFGQGWDTYRNYIRESRRTEAEYVAADVLDWLDHRPKDAPFFLYVHTIDPHVPYRPPPEFLARYGDPAYRGPASFRHDALLLEKVKMGKLRLRARDRAQLEALYDGEISYNDVHFAEILDGLERRGLADDTLVVVTSDHGEEFWDHGSVGHGHSVYDELLHVPLIVRLPGLTDGAAVRGDVGLVDVVPTVLDALGVPVPEEVQGHSLLGMLEGGGGPHVPRGTVSGFLDNWRALTVGHVKLVQRGAEEGRLYDLAADPHEQHDVASDHPIALRHARALLGLTLARTEPDHGHRLKPKAHRPAPRIRKQTVTIDDETAAQLRALGYVQ